VIYISVTDGFSWRELGKAYFRVNFVDACGVARQWLQWSLDDMLMKWDKEAQRASDYDDDSKNNFIYGLSLIVLW